MPLNKVKKGSNMYQWANATWNPIRGKCPHDCKYCYMKKFKVGELRLERKEFHTDLGQDNFIFVGSSTDMFADDVPDEWIRCVLKFCDSFDNKYLFQTKNPERFLEFIQIFPERTIFGTTIETNRETDDISNAPNPNIRMSVMASMEGQTMVSIEPIIEFDLDKMVEWMKAIKPHFVSIGADSKNSNLPEPSSDKVKGLIEELNKFTKVKIKSNLKRLL